MPGMKRWLLAAVFLSALTLAGCRAREPITYKLTLSGTAEGPGVVTFLDYTINVYQDEASNSCGDCADQPPCLYAGASAEDAVQKMSEAVRRADNKWDVASAEGGELILKEKQAGSVDKGSIAAPEVSPGFTISDNMGHEAITGTESEGAANTKTILDLEGNALRVPVDPQRIAAVYGPSYEALVVLGQEDRIVVCSDVQKDNFPWASVVFSRLDSLPCLQNVHTSVNFEELMNYKPDIVFSFSRPNELKQLQEAGVSAVPGTTPQTLDETKKLLLEYAHALGNGAVEKAEDYNAYFDEKRAYVTSRTSTLPDADRPSVYYAGIDLLTTYGSYSDIPELIEAAGGKAVTARLKAGNHTQIDFEQLAAWNPDYIFLDHGGINDGKTVEELKNEALTDTRYSALSAIANQRVYLSPSGVFYWDMGLQKILLLMDVAKTIHPELFADLDMPKEVMDFYQRFYHYDLTYDQAVGILDRENP